MEGFAARDPGARKKDLRHFLAVPSREMLADLHVVQIIGQVLSVEEA